MGHGSCSREWPDRAEIGRVPWSHVRRVKRHCIQEGQTGPRDEQEGTAAMKTMTCRQLGGPCDHALHGETANEVITGQDRHLRQAMKDGDVTHDQALRDMKSRWKHPKQSMDWYNAGVRPGAAWFHLGEPRVVFDFTIDHGVVRRIDFRAEPDLLALVGHRKDQHRS